MSRPDFPSVEEALQRAGAEVSASELHGILCGLLAADPAAAVDELVARIRPSGWGAPELDHLLADLAADTYTTLHAGDMSFVPLFPDDDQALEVRAEALAGWCQGFLYGLGLAGLGGSDSWPPEVAEIMTDFSELARAAHDAEDDAQEAEAALTELQEFVRVSAQLVFESMDASRQGRPGMGDGE